MSTQRTALVEGVLHLLCEEHLRLYLPGQTCGMCALAERDALGVLASRISDQDDQITALRRRVAELEHRLNDMQRAHNILCAHVRPNEDLLP